MAVNGVAKVLVRHEARHNHNGDVVGVQMRKGGHAIQCIEREYIHKHQGLRTVRTSSGDVWNVREVGHSDYQFVTVGNVHE